MALTVLLMQAPAPLEAEGTFPLRTFVSAHGLLLTQGPSPELAVEFGQGVRLRDWLDARLFASVGYSAYLSSFNAGVGLQPVVWLGLVGLSASAIAQTEPFTSDFGPLSLTLLGAARLRVEGQLRHEFSVELGGRLLSEQSFVVRAGYTVSLGANASQEPLDLKGTSFGLGAALGTTVMTASYFQTCGRCGRIGWLDTRDLVPTLTVEGFASFSPVAAVELQPLATVTVGASAPKPGVLLAAGAGLRVNVWYSDAFGSGVLLAGGASWHFAQVGDEKNKLTLLAPELTTLVNVLAMRFARHRVAVGVGASAGFDGAAPMPSARAVFAPIARLTWHVVF